MKISFSKYHGTGNDFIIVDTSDEEIILAEKKIAALCRRRFGIGADGLIILESDKNVDFKMQYFNADGKQGSMCGNGGRCIAAYANDKKIVNKHTKFIANDKVYEAKIQQKGIVKLKLPDVSLDCIKREGNVFVLDTGSPHYVMINTFTKNYDFFSKGKTIRYSKKFSKEGINVNFISIKNDSLYLTTYERGVEDLTYSCGTGTVASALAYSIFSENSANPIEVQTAGGWLKVYSKKNEINFTDIYLEGYVKKVFDGYIDV